METRTFHVVDQNGLEHEIILENSVARYYNAFKDGVKESFIAECLSFDAAFRAYCTQKSMRPLFSRMSSGSMQRSKNSSIDCPTASCQAMLEILHVLFNKEIICRSELESLKTKITSFFS